MVSIAPLFRSGFRFHFLGFWVGALLRSEDPKLRVVHIGCRIVQAIDMTTDETLFYKEKETDGGKLLRGAVLQLWDAEISARITH